MKKKVFIKKINGDGSNTNGIIGTLVVSVAASVLIKFGWNLEEFASIMRQLHFQVPVCSSVCFMLKTVK